MRIIRIILILLILPLSMKSQNATATIDSVSSCAGDTALVPVNVLDFIDIGAMTIYIGYDTNSAEFISLANVNPVIPGAITYNGAGGQVAIAYSSISGFTITNGKLFDLRYLLTSNSTELTFDPGTEIANTDLEVIPLDTNNGGMYNAINILEQPDSVQAYPDTDVTFTTLVAGNTIAYQWEENTGSGWISLQNNTLYSGTDTDSLTVHDVTLSYNGYTYRCILTSGNCSQYSDIALLEVNTAYPSVTIGQVNTCPEEIILEPIFAGDLFDVVEFTFNIGFQENVMDFIVLQNIHPDLQSGTLNTTPLNNPNGISIHWEHTDAVSITSGKMFDMEFDYSGSNTSVEFLEGTVVINSQSNLINVTLSDGLVNQQELPLILTQPESQTVQVNDQAIFFVEATGVASYQWQVSTDGGESWDNLENAIPYYNTNSEELTIDPVSWELNQYQYSCLLFGEFCPIVSEAAILSVDTLTGTGNEPIPSQGKLKILPNPAKEITTLVFNCQSPCDATINVFSIDGKTRITSRKDDLPYGRNEVAMNLKDLEPGLYIVELVLKGQTDLNAQRSRLIKVFDF